MMLLTLQMVLLYLSLGLLSGLTGGLLGLGGGVVLVPSLLLVFSQLDFPAAYLMHMAVATSLATIVFTASSATWVHHRKKLLEWPLVARLVPGIAVGSVFGAWMVTKMSSEDLRRIFGVFELLVAIQIGLGSVPPAMQKPPKTSLMLPASCGIGFISTVMGIGGGSLSVPFLVFCRIGMRQAIAVSSACGLPIAMIGAMAMVMLSRDTPDLPLGTVGYLYWPAAICIVVGSTLGAYGGAKLLYRVQIKLLRLAFASVLAVVGIGMVV